VLYKRKQKRTIFTTHKDNKSDQQTGAAVAVAVGVWGTKDFKK
jgi:hypothetical protein